MFGSRRRKSKRWRGCEDSAPEPVAETAVGHLKSVFVREQLLKDFNHSCSILARCYRMNLFFQAWNCIGDGHGESAESQECIVIFRVTDSYDAAGREAQLSHGSAESRAFIYSGRQDHD